ncbi:hypothetical protein ABZW11_26740 [Nonomuraea sp. NPDC004580]|uniref:hypothetical protein n=1 Tax=Nonomuraea sp. NPDC004580 TaxID=3154552 RepID=UPI0033A8E13A
MAVVVEAPGEVYELTLEVPQGQVIRYDLAALCSALGIDDPTRVAVETDGLRRALVTIYPSNPLTQVRAVTRDDLVMDRYGRYTVGSYHNGRPAKRRLHDPKTGSAQRFMMFGTTGAGKSKSLQLDLAAEKINGICSWVADLKLGQSVPEARGKVDWFADSQEEAILMLMAAVSVAEERMRRYSGMGRNSFVRGEDPLLHVTVDEANRLLEKGAPYRQLATRLIKELGRTGRSVGVGVRIAAQASHLEELGGSDTLRGMLKEGEVTLLRWSSSMMRQLVSDGLLPTGEQLQPIPKTLAPRELRSQFDPHGGDEDDAPGTQGMGYLLSGPRPNALMRHFRIGSIEPLPGLDPEILALYGDEEPARVEESSWETAGVVYLLRHDRRAMAAACEQFRLEQQGGLSVTVSGGTTDVDGEGEPQAGKAATTLKDRVVAVLGEAEAPMSADEVLAAVLEDGGKQVALGTVRNTLGVLAERGEAVRVGRNSYALNH